MNKKKFQVSKNQTIMLYSSPKPNLSPRISLHNMQLLLGTTLLKTVAPIQKEKKKIRSSSNIELKDRYTQMRYFIRRYRSPYLKGLSYFFNR